MKNAGKILFISFLIWVWAIPPAFADSKEITVSAAISLKNAFEEMKKGFESRTGESCVFNFGASGDLLKQVSGGAPVDLLVCASKKDMDEAETRRLIIPGTRHDIAFNRVVLIAGSSHDSGLSGFEGLNSAKIKRIAMGNPKTVPAGRYAEDIFKFYNLLPSIRNKLIYAENVRQVLDYVARGEVDAGVVYATDAATRSKEVRIISLAPDSSHDPVVYPLAIVKGSKNQPGANALTRFILSDEGQAVLSRYGFKPGRQVR